MSRKPLSIVDNDPELKDLKESLDAGYESVKETLEFLKKQAEDCKNKHITKNWDAIRDLYRERGLLPTDYSDDKYVLEFDSGVLYIKPKEGDSNPMRKFLEMLLSR